MQTANNLVIAGITIILDGYRVSCSGIVVAWEFCYQMNMAGIVTFSPGIWRITGMSNGNTDYALIQSNNVTYNQSDRGTSNGPYPCRIINLSVADQFTAPAGSVVGLFSNNGTVLLHTDRDSSITTYHATRNQTSISTNANFKYNIAIRVHLGKTVYVYVHSYDA